MAGTEARPSATRLVGLDFARFVAFAGMVLVNFHVVMAPGEGAVWAEAFLGLFEGKAAATFVVLAGIGLGLGAVRAEKRAFGVLTAKRALFLFIIGLINALVFPADILHYYAVYFLFGLLLVQASTRVLVTVMLVLPLSFIALLFVFNYEAGWNWTTLDYVEFWTVPGFLRNLLYNGWHPVIPWLSFLLLGLVLSRTDMTAPKTRRTFVWVGALMLVGAYITSALLVGFAEGDQELIELVGVAPVPPMPLYMLAGSGAALLVIGLSLMLFAGRLAQALNFLAVAGRQALTLYIAHILIGMGILEELGLLGGQSADLVIVVSFIFIIISVVYTFIWSWFFKRGPAEWLMRKVAG